MAFFDKSFEKELKKADRGAQYLGIPLFTIFSTLFLSPYPFIFDLNFILVAFILSLVGVIAIWFGVRYIIFFFRKRFKSLNFTFRLTFQLIVSSVYSSLILWLLDYLSKNYIAGFFGVNSDGTQYFNQRNLYLSTIVLTFLINTVYEGFYLFLKLSQKAIETERYKKESAEAQYQNLTSRLNPHFLFNSLNTLTTIVEEDPKKAVNYIRELSVVYRYVLNSQKLTWADLDAEMKFAQSYILLLKMRFEDNLKITINICDDYLNYHILAMTVQLLIENAVKHNEISDSHPLNIKVYCRDEKLVVTNNKQKRNIMPSTTKVGLHNISGRYRFLVNKEVIIEDKDDVFTVQVPLLKTIEEDREHIEEYF